FMQQYYQRLGGTVDELTRVVQHFDEDSRLSGYDRAAALGLMRKNSERLVQDQAVRMEEYIARLDRLHDQQAALANGGSFFRFASFVTNFDRPLAERTYASFTPALSLTFDGAMFGVIGFAVSWVAFGLVGAAF